jgi:hypothetical protein
MSHFFCAQSFLFVIALLQQAGAAEAVSLAGGFDGVHRSLFDVTIDCPAADVDEFRGVWDFEQLRISFTNRAPDLMT